MNSNKEISDFGTFIKNETYGAKLKSMLGNMKIIKNLATDKERKAIMEIKINMIKSRINELINGK